MTSNLSKELRSKASDICLNFAEQANTEAIEWLNGGLFKKASELFRQAAFYHVESAKCIRAKTYLDLLSEVRFKLEAN